jgi:Alpha-L-fucosidase
VEDAGLAAEPGDFGTPEHRIVAEDRLWESCQVSTQRLWGYAIGERWRSADHLLSFLVEAAVRGGNLLLNVGPGPDGTFPQEFVERAEAIGQWLDVHGEAIYGQGGGDVTEFITYGWQTVRGNNLYLVIRFWHGGETLRMPGLKTRVRRAVLLTSGQELGVEQSRDVLTLRGLPAEPPTPLFPVIRLECEGGSSRVDLQACKLGTGRRFTTS